MRRRPLLIAALRTAVGLALVSASAYGPLSLEAAPASLAERAQAAIGRTAHRSFRYSLGVWDAATGERIFAQNVDTPRRTASVMKLATTGAALLALGAKHEMYVEIRAARAPDAGVVHGNLWVEGTGDPGLSSHLSPDGADAALAALAASVRAAGVTRVEGDLVLDTSAFAPPDRHPGWGWKAGRYDWYMAPVTALTVNDACVDIAALPGPAAGAAARLEIAPLGSRVPFVNELTTTTDSKQHVVALDPPDAEGRIRVRGRVLLGSQGYTTSVACVDPPQLLADTLVRALSAAGVDLAGGVRIVRGPPAASWPRPAERPGVVLARHTSELADVVTVTNRRSQNLYAELVLRNLGLHLGGDGSFEGGCRAVRRVLELGDDFQQDDGSGLSRGNVASAAAIGSVLLRLYDSEHRIVFLASLAKGGDPDGTLRKRFRGARLEGRVLAKTGTLRDTKSLAGFVRAESGRVLAFAILCEGTNWRAQKLQDAVVEALVEGG